MDSLEWSKKLEVVSISRLVLRDLGFSVERINGLTDADMEAIADSFQAELSNAVGGEREHLEFIVCLYLDEHRSPPQGKEQTLNVHQRNTDSP